MQVPFTSVRPAFRPERHDAGIKPARSEEWLTELPPVGKAVDDRALVGCEGDPAPRSVNGRGEDLGIACRIDPRHLRSPVAEHDRLTETWRDEPLPATEVKG